jgi:outer membrane protein
MAFPFTALACASVLVLAATSAAHAQSAGSLTVRLSATQIAPEVKSGDLTPPAFTGTKADIEADTQPTAGITWMWTDHISLDLPLAAGFTHEIHGDGAIAGVGKIGEVKALPVTLLLQYRFLDPGANFRPYVGIGPTYAKFYKARSTAALTALTGGTPDNPTTLEVESKLALTAQVGMSFAITPSWSIDASVLKTKLRTRTTLSTGQTLDATLDPWSYTVGVGYTF